MTDMERRVVSKVLWRLVPFMILLYILNYLDRVNVGIAKLQMNADLKIDDSIYAFGASVFFIGYCAFEVPSNIFMAKIGARFWLARIMITWGICATAMALIQGKYSFYALRFLLGVAEAGFFPGMLLYLSYWVPARQRAGACAWFLTATALAQFIGQPLGTTIMRLKGAGGMAGWQWLFLLEGIPSIVVGFVVFFYLTDRPAQAKWLSAEERSWLQDCLDREQAAKGHGAEHGNFKRIFRDANVWRLCAIYCGIIMAFYTLQFWTPTLIKAASQASDEQVGLLGAIPFFAAALGMIVIGRISDDSGEHALTVAYCSFFSAAGILLVALFPTSTFLTVAGLTVAAIGIFGTLGPFWALPASHLSGVAAAAGIALINSMGNLSGGFIGNNIMGYSKPIGLIVDVFALIFAGCLTLRMRATSIASIPQGT